MYTYSEEKSVMSVIQKKGNLDALNVIQMQYVKGMYESISALEHSLEEYKNLKNEGTTSAVSKTQDDLAIEMIYICINQVRHRIKDVYFAFKEENEEKIRKGELWPLQRIM